MVTKTEVKTFLNISDSTHDDFIEDLIDYVTAQVETLIDNKIVQESITDEVLTFPDDFDLQPEKYLDLRTEKIHAHTKYYPVASETITYDGSDLTANTDYVLDEDTGFITFYEFVSDYKEKTTINYTAGYASTPADLKLVALEAIKDVFKGSGTVSRGTSGGEVKSKKVGNFSVTYADAVSSIMKYDSVLTKYKRLAI